MDFCSEIAWILGLSAISPLAYPWIKKAVAKSRVERQREGQRRQIRDLPASGAARVEGELQGEPALTTPLRGIAAVAFRVWLRAPVPFDRGNERTHDDFAAEQLSPFWLDDGTGRVFVDTTAGHVRALVSRPPLEQHDGVFSPTLRELIERSGADPLDWLTAGKLEAGEWCITPGAQVRVDGLVYQEVAVCGDRGDYRGPPTRRVLRGNSGHPLVIAVTAE
jgi:hypothetical protein